MQSSLRYLASDALIGRTAHQMQRFSYFAIGQNIEEGRLSEFDAERLLERVIEDRVAGGVGEVGEHDRVFLGERRRVRRWRRRTRAEIESPPTASATSTTAAGTRTFQRFLPAAGTSATFAALRMMPRMQERQEPMLALVARAEAARRGVVFLCDRLGP